MSIKQKSGKASYVVLDNENKKVEIPVEGSLGLLASGYKGIMLWREAKKSFLERSQKAEKINADSSPKKMN